MSERTLPNEAVVTEQAVLPKIAVLVPCYNEELAIGKVVRDFRAALPSATVYVYDNNSSDRTVEVAASAGALVRTEPLQGKGNVVCRMFADIQADVYVLVDGDVTYDATSAPAMVRTLIETQLDMVNGKRISEIQAAYRRGHRFGNALLSTLVSTIFGKRFTDILSGYRILSRRFVKSFPAHGRSIRSRSRSPKRVPESFSRSGATGSGSRIECP